MTTVLARFVRDERGSTILFVLLAALVLGAITISGHMVASTEVMISGSKYRGTQAFHLAEAGAEHALAWMADDAGDLDDYLVGPDGSPNTADDGHILGVTPLVIGDGSYEAIIVDNDENDHDLMVDSDNLASLVVIGRALGGAEVRIEIGLEAVPPAGGGNPPPFLFSNDLWIVTDLEVVGADAKMHSNTYVWAKKDALLDGTIESTGDMYLEEQITVEGSVLTGDDLTDYVGDHSFVDEVPVPEIDPTDYASYTDYTMTADGYIRDAGESIVHDGTSGDEWNGWQWKGSNWLLKDSGKSFPATPDATYTVEQDLIMEGQNGQSGDPLNITLLVDGSVEITGYAWLEPNDEDLLIVAAGDAKIVGGDIDYFFLEGHVLVHEQFELKGEVNLDGGIIVEDAEDASNMVPRTAEGSKLQGKLRLEFSADRTPILAPSTGSSYATRWWWSG